MNTALAPIHPTTVAVTEPTASRFRPGLLGGIGGLVFAGLVIVQNAMRSNFPTPDASAEEVMNYYADHRSATVALAVLMPLGLIGLVTFLGTVLARVWRGTGRVAAVVGAFGAAAIIGTFTIVTALDVAIAGYIHRGAADVTVVDALWVTHNAVFGFVMAAVGLALAGLTTASAAEGLLSKRWGVAGRVGAALLIGAAATTPAMIDGSPTFFVGLAGFLVWLAFMVRTSVALIRDRNS